MCGIVGAVAQRNVVPILIEGLKRLEYRGYDSAGVAVLNEHGALERVRSLGKVSALEAAVDTIQLHGTAGIAHTRWATHGKPSQANAHPHICRGTIGVVHNGIIENHEELRRQQILEGFEFTSETDTEVVVHQIFKHSRRGTGLFEAVRLAVQDLEGAYALGVISTDGKKVIAARRGSPLVIGLGIGEHFIASDVAALLPVTQRFQFLKDGDVAEITQHGLMIVDATGATVKRTVRVSEFNATGVERGRYRHYMLKEIFEQPRAIAMTLENRIAGAHVLESAFGPDSSATFDAVQHVHIVACGTSYHAGMVARYWFEALAGVPCTVEVASEFRYRRPFVRPTTLVVALSQSGETADTLAAVREAKRLGFAYTLAICNVAESSLVRESQLVLLSRAGPEIGVASTKAFTTQLTALLLLVVVLGRRRAMSTMLEAEIIHELQSLPALVEQTLELNHTIETLAEQFANRHHALFLGRGAHYPVAMEGALKLKEISYIHAEAYPAGELKHGPLALIDGDMPVIAVAPNNELLEKLKSNLHEVRARGGQLIVFTDATAGVYAADGIQVIRVPHAGTHVSPIVYTLPLQLLAYHVAVLKGTDVDQPRNLAKSVTVE